MSAASFSIVGGYSPAMERVGEGAIIRARSPATFLPLALLRVAHRVSCAPLLDFLPDLPGRRKFAGGGGRLPRSSAMRRARTAVRALFGFPGRGFAAPRVLFSAGAAVTERVRDGGAN
jgi:hypothetical protein